MRTPQRCFGNVLERPCKVFQNRESRIQEIPSLKHSHPLSKNLFALPKDLVVEIEVPWGSKQDERPEETVASGVEVDLEAS